MSARLVDSSSRGRRQRGLAVLGALGMVGGCGVDEPPTTPSWQVDVMPILAANCVRCHGYPTNGFATFGLRLDAYDDTEVAAYDAPIQGAAPNATTIARRTRRGTRPPGEFAMPPGRELGDYETTVLRNWAGLVDGSLKAPRGPGRADNAPPSLTVTEVARVGPLVTFVYELRDRDLDLVVGSLRGPKLTAVGTEVGVIADLVSGRDTFTLDLTGVAPGSYPLTARLDDGADIDGPDGTADYIELAIGDLEVTP